MKIKERLNNAFWFGFNLVIYFLLKETVDDTKKEQNLISSLRKGKENNEIADKN